MLDTKFSPWPAYTDEEVGAVARVLISNRVNYWTGAECREFEREFAGWVGARYAVALMNGTVALEAALRALEVGPGDEVIVTPRTFLASVSCIVAVGARPVFADVDRVCQNITADTVRAVLSARTKAIICVHLGGWPCDMGPIMALAEKEGLYVLEDCAQAHGASYKGKSVGTIGHVGAWSFCQDKIITTGGEGGMVTTNDEKLWRKIWSLKDHGKSWDAVYERHESKGFRWLHETFGTNWRMTEMQAAIGRIQLRRMPEWHAVRCKHAGRLSETCRMISALRVPDYAAEVQHAWYRYYVFVRPEMLKDGWSRDGIIEEINRCGVPCFQGSCSEVYLEKAFDKTDFRPEQPLMVARELGLTSLMFLVHPTLTVAEIDRTCEVISVVLADASA